MKQKKQKNTCPITASKQYQGTGKELFADHSNKTSGTKNPQRKNRIWSKADYEASPLLNTIINSFDTPKIVLASDIINTMHEHFAHLIIEQIRDQGIPFEVLEGQTFTLTLTFTKERPEGP